MNDAEETGRVVAHHGVAVLVRFASGATRQVWLGPDQRVVVGDRVVLAGERVEVLPAHGVLRRRDARGRERTIAVNLDVLAIVIAPEPREPPGYIDRGIVIARAADIEPHLVLNKFDLEAGTPLADRLEAIYGASLQLHRVSAQASIGLESLRAMLAGGRIGALVGPSGVGKSSLLNALVPDLALTVGALNRASGHGRHTTTTTTLHEIEGGGLLVDTAGFKDFIAVDLQATDAAGHFPGFEAAVARGCRFRNCLHQTEPDCAVLAALAAGEIDPRRHRAYQNLLADLASAPSPYRGSGGSRSAGRSRGGGDSGRSGRRGRSA